MPWMTALAIGGSALIGGASSFLGGQAQSGAADQAAYNSNQQYLQTRQDFAPWRNSGIGALGQINALMGLGGNTGVSTAGNPIPTSNAFASGGGGATPLVGQLYANQSKRGQTPIQDIEAARALGLPISDLSWSQAGFGPGGAGYFPAAQTPAQQAATSNPMDAGTAQQNAFASFRTDPGYQFAFDQGQKALQSSAAARGILNSGATAKALTNYGQGLADQQYGNYFARLQSLAGLGQSATGSTAQAGGQSAGQSGNALMAGGNARASAYGGVAQAANQGIGNYLFANQFGGAGGYTPPGLNSGAGSVGYF